MELAELQDVIERTFGERDRARGVAASVAWLAEEVGELAQAIRKGTHEQRVHEFGDRLHSFGEDRRLGGAYNPQPGWNPNLGHDRA